MPSFRRRESVIDADSVVQPPQDDPEQRSADPDEALALAEEAEAEAAEAEAIAAAARARAKAIRLRRQAAEAQASERASETVAVEVAEPAVDTEPDADEAVTDTAPDADEVVTDTEPDAGQTSSTESSGETDVDATADTDQAEAPSKRRRLRMPRVRWKIVAAVFAILLTLVFVAASGYMVWQHRLTQQEQQRTAEFTAAARQSVVTLMSLNFNNAQEDVQRIIDNSTGQFKQDFEAQAEDFTQVAKDSKVVTEVTVNVASLKSMTDNNATALVSATSRVTNTAGANQEPRSWRLMVDLVREGDQIKMSKVEFVP